ncbi:nuclear receptor 2C2-associated protein [Lingula anatina]|uniref:Nuclear receptor 2C2-associated protein n=1 Tax=Lingula anatina TaxID=7574 RepID=A0A1S3HTL1_LINAN|nr:nuclear receptor 2C2-associated protein [Lingula anatina]|eukprot:XP_013389358.1 nuclear receptor 2C2-associated protein [Lingula anatina]
MAASILKSLANYRVSSVLNRDVKQFGKKFLLDGDDETCWNSDQGSPQWVLLEFSKQVVIEELHIQFQGGFAGKECHVEVASIKSDEFTELTKIFPEDSNKLQVFTLTPAPPVSKLRIVFTSSTDFYGRITIYKLDVIGRTGSHD